MRQLKIIKQVTNRETSSVDKYLNEISKIELLTPEEEVELARRIKKGDKAALDRLVGGNLRFVVSVSKQYQNQGLTLPDLINEGNLGLIKAAERFDETKGFKFISYAVWWIRQTILQALAEQARIVRLPQNKIGSLNKINKILTELEQKYEREPSLMEVSDIIGISPDQLKEYFRSNNRHVSMDAPIGEEEDRSVHDLMENNDTPSPDNNLLYDSLKREIERALKSLTDREAKILKMYFGLESKHPYTLEEIGKELKLTRERVRQIKDKALRNLKQSANKNKILKTYLG
ncbi:MAG: sigma-70 family RNA polymerase sigma factor [Bacteroidota bacterium]